MDDLPPLQKRPGLHGWLTARRMGVTDLAKRWGMSPQAASRYLLPFGHSRRVIPDEARIADVLEWTRGEIGARDWYPAELSAGPLPASIGRIPAAGAVQ